MLRVAFIYFMTCFQLVSATFKYLTFYTINLMYFLKVVPLQFSLNFQIPVNNNNFVLTVGLTFYDDCIHSIIQLCDTDIFIILFIFLTANYLKCLC